MSFFPRSLIAEPSSSSLTPFFRFLDDFETYNNPSRTHDHANNSQTQRTSSIMTTFNPKFDIRELVDAYELHGELPGIDQKHVDIEFTDSQTLRISGRIERSYESGTPQATSPQPSESLPAPEKSGAASLDAPSSTAASEDGKVKPHKASVQDEEDNGWGTVEHGTESKEDKDMTKEDQAKAVAVKAKETSKEPKAKLWVSERSIGEFSRTFTFPVRIDQDTVKASMNNGVLSITVPKMKKQQSRKITIS